MRALSALTVPAQPLQLPAHIPGASASGASLQLPIALPWPKATIYWKNIGTNTCEHLYESNKMSYKQRGFVRENLCQFFGLLCKMTHLPSGWEVVGSVCHCLMWYTDCRDKEALSGLMAIKYTTLFGKICSKIIYDWYHSKWTGSTLCLQLLSIFTDDLEDGIKKTSVEAAVDMKGRGLRRKAQFEIIRVLTNWRNKLEMTRGL